MVEELECRDVPTATAADTYLATLYQGFLGRPLDAPGLAYWTAQSQAGATREQVAAGILSSNEFHSREVQILYQVFLGRPVDPAGLAYWGNILQAGGDYTLVKAGVVGSDEFYAHAGGTNFNFLNRVYEIGLARPLDEPGRAYWGMQLADGVPLASVAAEILVSPEAEQVKVAGVYQEILGRGLDRAGASYWVNALLAGRSDESVLAGVAGSAEFFNQLGAFLARSNAADANTAAALFLSGGHRFDTAAVGAEELDRHIITDRGAVIPPPPVEVTQVSIPTTLVTPVFAPLFVGGGLDYFGDPGYVYDPGSGAVYDPGYNGVFVDPGYDPGFAPADCGCGDFGGAFGGGDFGGGFGDEAGF
jgi:hypothetical protein